MDKKPVIELENIWKTYKLGSVEVNALRGIDVSIYDGNFATIMGPSGSGKSTLLNIIGCLDIPTKGKVYLDGKDTSQLTEDQLAQVRGKKIGFIFQQFNLLPHLTALENVILPMVFQGSSLDERRERGKYLLGLVDLKDRMNHLPSELSGGQRQRVAIARAFANEPEFVIADEPTGNLDSTSGKIIMDLLVKFHKEEKGTIVVVTHDPLIAKYSENILHIQDGKIVHNHFQEKEVLWNKNNS